MNIMKEDYDGELIFLEAALDMDILENKLLTDVGYMNAFYEENDNESPENNRLVEKVFNGITKILTAIGNMISRFIRVISNIGKESATFDDYIHTTAGTSEWNYRYARMCNDIDQYMRSCRPCISMISNIMECDIEKVETTCDMLNSFIEKAEWEKIAKSTLKRSYSKKQWKKYADEAAEWNNRLVAANNKLKSGNKEIKDRKRRISALEKMARTHSRFTTKLFGFVGKNEETIK